MSAEPARLPVSVPNPERSLHRKLAQVMYEAERIPKNGRAPKEMGGYPFVQVGDAADFIRKALAEKVVTMIPTAVRVVGQVDRPTKSGGSMTTVDLIVTWTLTDGESGETATIESFGAGADGGDKYSGKASTSAMKYALLSGFLLSTGEDSELGRDDPGRSGPAAAADAGGATEHLLGSKSVQGKVMLGSAEAYKLEARETSEGWAFGFRLDMGSDASIPQVMVMGDAAKAFLEADNDPMDLLNANVRLHGMLYAVRAPGRKSFNRLKATELVTEDERFPPDDPVAQEAPEGPAETSEAPTARDDEPDAAVPVEAGVPAPALCGATSPYGDGLTCALAPGHRGAHKQFEGFGTSWTD